jgi:hypothetical protein
MLATTFVESSHTEKFRVPAKHGKGHEKARTVKVWRNFKPIEEIGHGRGHAYYYLPRSSSSKTAMRRSRSETAISGPSPRRPVF